MPLNKVKLFGYSFLAAPDIQTVADAICTATLTQQKDLLVVTPNAYTLQVQYQNRYRDIQAYTRNADFVLPDGMPVVWLSKLKYSHPIPGRLTGSDLFPLVWHHIKTRQLKATLILPGHDAAEALTRDYPEGCNTLVPDFFDVTDEVYIAGIARQALALIEENRSVFVFIGLGDPKQILISRQIALLRQTGDNSTRITTLLLGASFQFYLGMTKRAPAFFRKSGLEWFYRLCKEPRRLWKRYTIDNLKFLALAARELVRSTK